MTNTLGFLLHFFYLTQALALLFKDALWLRLAMIASNSAGLTYYILEQKGGNEPLWLAAFLLINVVHLALLVRSRSSLIWTDEELDLRNTVFKQLSAGAFKKLMKAGRWKTYKASEILASEGREVKSVMFVYSGAAVVQVGARTIAHLRHNTFVGEMSFVTGAPASATVKTVQLTRCLVWQAKALRDLLAKESELRTAMQSIFSHDLMGKLAQRDSEKVM